MCRFQGSFSKTKPCGTSATTQKCSTRCCWTEPAFPGRTATVEPDGTIRLYFTLEQAQTKLHRSRQSATRIFRELEYSGLIIRKKQGLGKPALITLNYPADAKLIAKEGEDAQA